MIRIGYPCINLTLECKNSHAFRLSNYSEERLVDTVKQNLECLREILRFNKENKLLFFRIHSGIIPFASHEICTFPWASHFKVEFEIIADYIKTNGMRVCTHPDHFVILNSPNNKIVANAIAELEYHDLLLDLMAMGSEGKLQIHVGGEYKNKEESKRRFIEVYLQLPDKLKKRLVIENDDRIYSLKDCMEINKEIGIPVLFDIFHHHILNNGEDLIDAFFQAKSKWREKDGNFIIDYSTQEEGRKIGNHSQTIDVDHFKSFLESTKYIDYDIMLEIKDKELSAIKAVEVLSRVNA